MLSVEKRRPPPPDPQCSDLHDHDHNPLIRNFSIRDYVFTARSKDIKTNWPFSLKNLQLCLRHGVKDVLPPFQPLDAVRNQVCGRCTVDNSQSIRNNVTDGELATEPDRDDHVVLDSFNIDTRRPNEIKLPNACIDTVTSCRSGESNLFPSTTTSVYQSDIEQSLPSYKPTGSPLQTDTSLEAASVEFEAEPAAPPVVAHKTQSTARTSGKNKCKLIVKFSSQSDRSSAEDIASNCTTQSETMASKICPVCKTFSSSSNTTLNAHIDQCLSVEESTPKWTVDSKLTRHRIKPRKTRLMVDIYATALPCTLEDLDRRNGSNWASASGFPTLDPESDKSEIPVEETAKQRVSPVPSDDHPSHADVGDVYIDANGIKLRILSKSDDAPSVSKVIEHLRPRKPFKGGKGSKFLSARKKKRRASKFSKYLKLAQNKKLFSTKARSSQISGGLGKKYVADGSTEKEGCNMQKQANPVNSGTLRQWACSKRTDVAKKLNNRVHHQHLQRKWNVSEDLRFENDQSRFHSSILGQNLEEEELMGLSGNPVSSPDKTDGLENVFYEAQASHVVEQSPMLDGSSLSVASIKINVGRPLTLMKRNARLWRKERTPDNGYHMLKPPRCDAISALKAMKVSSARKVMLSSRRTLVAESESDVANKCSGLKRSQLHLMTNEEIVPWDSEAILPYDLKHNCATNNQSGREDMNKESSLHRSNGLTIRQNVGVLSVSGRKEPVVTESSQLPFQCYSHSSHLLDKVDDVGPGCKDFQCLMDDIASQPSSKTVVGETIASSHCKSVSPELNKLGPRTKIRSNSLQYRGPLCNVQALTGSSGPSFVGGGQEMFYADQLGNGMLAQNVGMGEDLDSEVAQGSSFPEVDPIPIPGPPGSFLPSPRDMGSEDFQGNSSLTTSRVQSSQDQHDFIDGDSSDSPASATSTISNSTAGRYDLKSSESLPSVGPHAGQDKIRSGFSGGSVDSSIENAALVARSTSMAGERLASFDKDKLKVSKIPLGFKTDNEPCCCQRKERASQDHVILNSKESQLLKRRAMASASLSDVDKQTSCNFNARPNNVDARADIFSLSSCPSSKSEEVVLPATKGPTSQNVLRGPMDAGIKFSARGDCDSIMSPSSSNSILRLMGKNLMVVNRDQDESMPPGQVQQQTQINHLTSKFSVLSGVSPTSTVQSQVYHQSFPPNFHRGSLILGRDPQNVEGQRVDAGLSNGVIRSHTNNSRTSQMLYQGIAYSYPNQHMDGGFAAPLELCEFKADYGTTAPQKMSKHRPIGSPMGHMDQAVTIPDHQHKSLLSAASNPVKKIITIDDSPETESEADSTRDIAKYGGGFGGSHVVSSNIAIPSYNTKCATPFYGSRPEDPSLLPELPSVQSAGFHSLPTRQANASPVRWPSSCTSDGSGVLQQSPFIATPSSSRGQLRSVLYK